MQQPGLLRCLATPALPDLCAPPAVTPHPPRPRFHTRRRFVFCDNGTKKHPKIYGFAAAEAAARAFDLLTCKRALEKGRGAAGLLAASPQVRCARWPRCIVRRMPCPCPARPSQPRTRPAPRTRLPCPAPGHAPQTQALGTNHPAGDYQDVPLLAYLAETSRDDLIYGLKQCAKRGHSLEPG